MAIPWSFSTIWRTADCARAGAPPSSTMITRRGWPPSPPRLLTSATQARMAGGAGPEMVPRGPASTPNVPKTISLFLTGGVFGAPEGPGALTAPEAAPDEGDAAAEAAPAAPAVPEPPPATLPAG